MWTRREGLSDLGGTGWDIRENFEFQEDATLEKVVAIFFFQETTVLEFNVVLLGS